MRKITAIIAALGFLGTTMLTPVAAATSEGIAKSDDFSAAKKKAKKKKAKKKAKKDAALVSSDLSAAKKKKAKKKAKKKTPKAKGSRTKARR